MTNSCFISCLRFDAITLGRGTANASNIRSIDGCSQIDRLSLPFAANFDVSVDDLRDKRSFDAFALPRLASLGSCAKSRPHSSQTARLNEHPHRDARPDDRWIAAA